VVISSLLLGRARSPYARLSRRISLALLGRHLPNLERPILDQLLNLLELDATTLRRSINKETHTPSVLRFTSPPRAWT
jgi:hypothetical protein